MKLSALAVAACLTLSLTWAANILVVLPMSTASHGMLLDPLARELGARGHQVTYLSAKESNQQFPNVTQIIVPSKMVGSGGKSIDFLQISGKSAMSSILTFSELAFPIMEQILNNANFTRFMRGTHKFDLLIHEAFLSEGLMAGLAGHFQVPFIGYAPFIPSAWTNYMVGNVAPTAYIPEPFTGYPYHMTFLQRLHNFLLCLLSDIKLFLFYLPQHDALMRRHFGTHLPYIQDIMQNMSVLLVNDHIGISFPRPSVPNMVSVAGLHLSKPKPLPQDIQKYLDKSKNGAILFSLGSTIKASGMTAEKRQLFIDAFAQLPENVLWKFEQDIANHSDNVKISKWLPQHDILAHANVKLFITHGGMLSTTDTIDRGVPILGIPIFGDQPINIATAVNAGVGLSLDYDRLTVEQLVQAIRQVIDNPKYKEATDRRSRIYHDRVLPPLDLAIWWIEYVLRHNGAPHFKSAAQYMTWYQKEQLDVVAALLIALAVALFTLKAILYAVIRLVTKTGQNFKEKIN